MANLDTIKNSNHSCLFDEIVLLLQRNKVPFHSQLNSYNHGLRNFWWLHSLWHLYWWMSGWSNLWGWYLQNWSWCLHRLRIMRRCMPGWSNSPCISSSITLNCIIKSASPGGLFFLKCQHTAKALLNHTFIWTDWQFSKFMFSYG